MIVSTFKYQAIRFKRLFLLTLMIFSMQFLTMIYLPLSNMPLPFYPPMGVAFVLFYLFGMNALWGLFSAGICAYLIHGFTFTLLAAYLLADLGCAYLGVLYSEKIFSSDIRPFENVKESAKFIGMQMLLTCTLSSLLRWPLDASVDAWFLFWLADLLAIFVFASFILTWVYIPFYQESFKQWKSLFVTAILFVGFLCWLAYHIFL
jgi:hypothetical protein